MYALRNVGFSNFIFSKSILNYQSNCIYQLTNVFRENKTIKQAQHRPQLQTIDECILSQNLKYIKSRKQSTRNRQIWRYCFRSTQPSVQDIEKEPIHATKGREIMPIKACLGRMINAEGSRFPNNISRNSRREESY